MMGDANLCSSKWNDTNFIHKAMATQLKDCLDRNGFVWVTVRPTFQADHCQANGNVIESHIDHVYHNITEEDNIVTKTLKNSSSDHFPVITTCIHFYNIML